MFNYMFIYTCIHYIGMFYMLFAPLINIFDIRAVFSACLQHLCGIEIPKVAIATKHQQMSCDVIHRRFPASLSVSSEKHERGPSEKSAREPLSFVPRERNVRNKLVNINNFFFGATALTSYPQTRGV